ncbi:hypothetical protein CF326_g6034 [Tilletia indica]|nr:hypothetical protein CF326_g6034 [Tilletia indica]
MSVSQNTLHIARDGTTVRVAAGSLYQSYVPQPCECYDDSMVKYEPCRVCIIRQKGGQTNERAECSWKGRRAINGKRDRQEQYVKDSEEVLMFSSSSRPLPGDKPGTAIKFLSDADITLSEYHLAGALLGELTNQCVLILSHTDGVITRPVTYDSMASCEGCSRYFLAAWHLCVRCGLELCPSCYTQLMQQNIVEQRRRREQGAAADLRTSNDFLACLRRTGDAYPTHSGSDFVVMAQISCDDALYLCGAARHVHTRLVGEFSEAMSNSRTDSFEGQLSAEPGHIFPDRPGLTLRKHSSLRITDDSQFERAVAYCLSHVDTPVVLHRRPSSEEWTPSRIQAAFAKGQKIPVTLTKDSSESAKAAVISPKQLLSALQEANVGVDCRDFPKDADLSAAAPELDRQFRAAVAYPSATSQSASAELSLLADNITYRDAKAKVYAASAAEKDGATTNAHVDEAMAVNVCLWAGAKEAVADDDGVAAHWLIIPHEDFSTVVAFYQETYGIDHSDRHPIFSQSRFLSTEFLETLQNQRGVQPWSVPQRAGDTIIVPPGSIHQVRNLRSCFKIAADVFPPTRAGIAAQISQLRAAETLSRGPYSVDQLGRDALALFPTMVDAFLRLISRRPKDFRDEAHSSVVTAILSASLIKQRRLETQVQQLEMQAAREPSQPASASGPPQDSLSLRNAVVSVVREQLRGMIVPAWRAIESDN